MVIILSYVSWLYKQFPAFSHQQCKHSVSIESCNHTDNSCVLTMISTTTGAIMLAVVVILAVCGYCSAQCSTTPPPAGLTIPKILKQPAAASKDS